jgi:hypothetical protein
MGTKEPVIGQIQRGHAGTHNRSEFIYLACEICGKKRWVRIVAGTKKPVGLTEGKICKTCAVKKYGMNKAGKGSSNWHGGRHLTTDGYMLIFLDEEDFFHPMTNCNSYVMEHRLVMAKRIGRCLQEWEVVHHKGVHFPMDSIENKSDNSLENLQLVSDQRHSQVTILENRIVYQKREIRTLKARIKELESFPKAVT